MKAGAGNAITDVPGIEVGHATESEALTGATVILARGGVVAGVDVRGAAPGTRETDLLEPQNLVQRVQAVLLAGGSAYGLAAADGVMRFLEERGLGQPVGSGRVVPIVPAAVIFDLDVGSWSIRPGAEHGYRAAEGASASPPSQGNVGAGTGARAGGLKGGIGSASSVLDNGLIVGAIGVVNSIGRAHDPLTGGLYGAPLGLEGEFAELRQSALRHPALQQPASLQPELRQPTDVRPSGGPDDTRHPDDDGDYSSLFRPDSPLAGASTIIGVVATNARLDKAQARKLAQMAHDGLARAIRPAHTMFDGDTIFAVATGERELAGAWELAMLGAVAADTFGRALVHGVLRAESAGGLDSYRQAYPELVGTRP